MQDALNALALALGPGQAVLVLRTETAMPYASATLEDGVDPGTYLEAIAVELATRVVGEIEG